MIDKLFFYNINSSYSNFFSSVWELYVFCKSLNSWLFKLKISRKILQSLLKYLFLSLIEYFDNA